MNRRIGILGCGKIALHHAAALKASGATIVAGSTKRVDSPNWARFLDVAPQARFAADGRDLLTDKDIDAVVACLPWQEAPLWTEILLACPKPILLEKPIALDAATLSRVLEKEPGSANKIVGFNRRFYAPVRRLRERLDLGGFKAVYATISEDTPRHVEGHGPAVLEHLAAYSSAHSLDLLLHLLGPLKVVRSYRYDEKGYPAPLASHNSVLETGSGRPVFLALNADDPVNAGLRFLFDDHTSWTLSPLETLKIFRGYDISTDGAVRRYTPKLIETVDEPTMFKPGFLAQSAAFLSGDYGPAARPHDSLVLLQLVGAIKTGVQ